MNTFLADERKFVGIIYQAVYVCVVGFVLFCFYSPHVKLQEL